MKALTKTTTAITALVLTAAPAFAATTAQQDSGLLTWLFIGFAGLIVVGQLVPAIVMGFGMVKGIVSGHAENH
jgi:FtsH-binding integral membrane protein